MTGKTLGFIAILAISAFAGYIWLRISEKREEKNE